MSGRPEELALKADFHTFRSRPSIDMPKRKRGSGGGQCEGYSRFDGDLAKWLSRQAVLGTLLTVRPARLRVEDRGFRLCGRVCARVLVSCMLGFIE